MVNGNKDFHRIGPIQISNRFCYILPALSVSRLQKSQYAQQSKKMPLSMSKDTPLFLCNQLYLKVIVHEMDDVRSC
jgi:hypothetical protein